MKKYILEFIKTTSNHDVKIIAVGLIVVIIILLLLIIILLSSSTSKDRKKDNIKLGKNKYVISTLRIHGNGKEEKHYHGQDKNNWVFTYEQAVKVKNKINHLFDEVNILDYSVIYKDKE